ncbi:MAG: cysteine--tRNA ligase [Candidatus Omnitrophica bacterium]|nr:cysteine--tRNA ligase [Candidatus Omnitrophota bacterium]MDD5081124.1 cysteine--tRNA ligase [Candidatus Omnitrophota bacterium]
MLKIQNTLSKTKEEFKSINNNRINMYTCGVTVYDHCHIGHARSLYLFEVIRRYLKFSGYKVSFVRNITDVDDKIINKAKELAAKDGQLNDSLSNDQRRNVIEQVFDDVRTKYIDSYYSDLRALNIPRADVEPKATENIKDMQDYITALIEKGYAYPSNGNVYFSVRKFKDYGKLSGKKIDDLLSSVRIDNDPDKKDPLDFALWKASKDDEPFWESPWGRGRPGWHIECSVMSRKFLGSDTLDIHGGGRDLVFPHHENEIAQSEALTDTKFSEYWIHHGLLTIEKQKMSKSLGNFLTVRDVLDKIPADILKMFFLRATYSSSIDFSWDIIEEVKKAYDRIVTLRARLSSALAGRNLESAELTIDGVSFDDMFRTAMDDDFNMPKALAVLFDLVSTANALMDKNMTDDTLSKMCYAQGFINRVADIFVLDFNLNQYNNITDDEIEECILKRLECKKNKEYEKADAIRKTLLEKGVTLNDNKDGTTWKRMI